MIAVVLQRFAQGVVALLVLTVVVFLVSRVTGDPLTLLLPHEASAEDFARVREALGLDRPLYEQYWRFLSSAMQGDLGRSYRSGLSVNALIAERFPASLTLAVTATVVSWGVGVPLGVLAAQLRGTKRASIVQAVAVLGQSAPSFWVGILLILVFAVWLRWLPSGTNASPVHAVLPTLTLSLFGMAGVSRLLRSGMLEVLDGDVIKFARSKGLSPSRVVWVHALRNALLPALGYGGVFFASIISSAVVVEVVFAWPGVGLLTYDAIRNRDFPVVQGVVLYAGAVVIAVNLIVDILYALADPRVRTHGR